MLGFCFDKVEGLGDGNLLETIDVFRFRAPKKLKLNWLAKRVGGDTFTIRGERIFSKKKKKQRYITNKYSI